MLDVSECPAPAYSHGPARRIDVASQCVQRVVNDGAYCYDGRYSDLGISDVSDIDYC